MAERVSACNVYGNSCFTTGTAGFVMAAEVANLMQASNEKNRATCFLSHE